ncbi:MAG: ribonuclease R [Candidatus Marinimicrobia bacterium]|nr:ribonuclease R [Candidatus Neomarinimicrobiota bacterium]|tara:strand:- start:6072 stop:8165 length:2094 start_codon:yes stop_codon:yes gene_type:complete
MKSKILDYLRKQPGKLMRRRELARRMGVRKSDYQTFRRAVKELTDSGKVLNVKGGALVLPSSGDRLSGTLTLTGHGYGFVTTDARSSDIFVGGRNLGGALHGDTVEIVVLPRSRRYRSEGIVERIISRKTDQFVGIVESERGRLGLQIEPVSPRRGIVLDGKKGEKLSCGDIVLAKVTDWGSADSPVTVHILERIGSIENPEDDMAVVCFKYDLTPEFPSMVEEESHSWSKQDIEREIPNRTDLRHLTAITIDPSDARDVDDAISLELLSHGNVTVGVHIADVSFYVPEKSELDREARKRGNTVYFAEGTVRMLPDNLSADLCSLLPKMDRLAMSVLIELDSGLNVISSRVEESVIQSRVALAYGEVQEILDGKKKNPFGKELIEIKRIAKRLTAHRQKAGSIDFDIPEPIFRFKKGGIPHEILPSERLDSHRLVEEFMLLANREVARKVTKGRKRKDEFVFRIHDEPSADDMERFVAVLRRLNLAESIPSRLKPADFRDILAMVETSPYRDLIEKLALRTMSKAVYSVHNRGHFGLAFNTYTHFTSPIRRYSDLMVHRYLKKHILRKIDIKGISRDGASAIARELTESEIKSLEAEREYIKLKQIRWLSQHIGEKFDAVVSGVISAGFFAELENTMVEGFVSVESLTDDRYYYDELEIAIIGKRFREMYQLGRKVKIRVRNVSLEKRRADFDLVEV